MSEVTFSPFDAADYLTDEEGIAAFLEEMSDCKNPETLAAAVGAVARARSMMGVAKAAGISRAGMNKAFGTNGGNPRLGTLMKVADALGLEVVIRPKKVA